MKFNVDQIAMLAAPLDRANVSTRVQGSATVSYIAGWHAIAEANRIFGFDAWTRELRDLTMVVDTMRLAKDGKTQNHYVAYRATVRVTVGTIVREGVGYGEGIDKFHGQAHESAIKEAETDAMKRALMTFGNPFGLALYDKTQSNVADASQIQAQTDKQVKDAAAAYLKSLSALKTEIDEFRGIAGAHWATVALDGQGVGISSIQDLIAYARSNA